MKKHQKCILLFLLMTSLYSSCVKIKFGAPGVVSSGLDKKKMLDLINQVRTSGCKCGSSNMPKVIPLSWNDTLELAAINHSADMSKRKYFSHINKENLDPGDRLDKLKFIWTTYGENIARGQSSEEEVMDAWLKSTGHCKNIMSSNFTLIGVSRVDNYWTQVFANR